MVVVFFFLIGWRPLQWLALGVMGVLMVLLLAVRTRLRASASAEA